MTRFARGPVVKKEKGEKSTPWKVMVIDSDKDLSCTIDEEHEAPPDQVKTEISPNSRKRKRKFKKQNDSTKTEVQSDSKTKSPTDSKPPSEEEQLKRTWKNIKRTKQRQENRQRVTTDHRICFKCREPGHTLQECPNAETQDKRHQCYKCGSTEHVAHRCKVKIAPNLYPFAKCFICCEMGHIAGQCPDNPKGVYPNGGACRHCQSVEHRIKDCPTHLSKLGIGNQKLSKISANTSIEGDDAEDHTTPKLAKKSKIATF